MAREAVTAERARLARELHDIVTHSLTVIVIQSQGAARVSEELPPAVAGALSAIEASGRAALTEMRHLLGLLRDADPQSPQRTPQPGLGDVRPLIEHLRSTGVDVAFDEQDSGSVDLSPGVELTAFRIVQEGLTNVLKHAPGASVGVSVLRSPSEVVVRVSDDGARVPAAPAGVSGGRGLIGMRERIAVYSGDLQAGPLPEGGWRARRLRARSAGAMTIRVLVADDQELVRTGFALILAREPDIEVVCDAVDGRDAVALRASRRPDVALMDIRMPAMDGLAATRAITADPDCRTKVLILTTFDTDAIRLRSPRGRRLRLPAQGRAGSSNWSTRSASWRRATRSSTRRSPAGCWTVRPPESRPRRRRRGGRPHRPREGGPPAHGGRVVQR